MWLWVDSGDADVDETEGTEGESFTGDGYETGGEPAGSLTWKVHREGKWY